MAVHVLRGRLKPEPVLPIPITAKNVPVLRIVIGVRGEVALIVATKGLSVGLIESKYFTSVILLIIVSSVLVPILLKKSFSKEDKALSN